MKVAAVDLDCVCEFLQPVRIHVGGETTFEAAEVDDLGVACYNGTR